MSQQSALMTAASMGESFRLEDLLKANPNLNVNEQDSRGYTPVHFAASLGHLDCLKILIDKHNARLDQSDRNDSTPLIKAASSGFPDIVDYLLKKNARVNHQNNDYATALFAVCDSISTIAGQQISRDGISNAVTLSSYLEVVRLLLRAKADVNIRNKSEKTALMMAVRSKQPQLVQLLLEAGAKAEDKDALGITVSDYAEGDKIILALLRGEKVDLPTPAPAVPKPTTASNNATSSNNGARPTNCVKCSASLSSTAKFCSKCGNRV